MIKILTIIPDSHAKPGVDNDRYTWLGRFLADLRPEVIVNLGDMADMPSLSMFDIGKKSFEGRRYQADLKVTHDALAKIQAPIDEYNKTLKEKKLRMYNPKKYMLYGNHEHRISRAVENDAKLEGTMSLDDLRYEAFGWETVPFKTPLLLEGVSFQHYFTAGLLDKSIAGENLGRTILKRYHASAFQGHTHTLNIAMEANAKGELMVAGSLGCLFEHEETYVSKQAQNQWYRGITILRNVHDGVCLDIQHISLNTLKSEYK